MHRYSPRLKSLARGLRSDLTDAEQRLWHRLRRRQLHGIQFYRQRPLGAYIVDFFAPAAGLVVEVDGSQYLEDAGAEYDARRDAYLRALNLEVLSAPGAGPARPAPPRGFKSTGKAGSS
jgi:very-short-patch-repair endonuclease